MFLPFTSAEHAAYCDYANAVYPPLTVEELINHRIQRRKDNAHHCDLSWLDPHFLGNVHCGCPPIECPLTAYLSEKAPLIICQPFSILPDLIVDLEKHAARVDAFCRRRHGRPSMATVRLVESFLDKMKDTLCTALLTRNITAPLALMSAIHAAVREENYAILETSFRMGGYELETMMDMHAMRLEEALVMLCREQTASDPRDKAQWRCAMNWLARRPTDVVLFMSQYTL
jgi:hypothetical protein